MTAQTPATAEMEKWLRIRHVFLQIFDSGPKEKRRILLESIPVIRIRSHLWKSEISLQSRGGTGSGLPESTPVFRLR